MKASVVIQTDFGVGGGGEMVGVIKSIDMELFVYDFNQCIEPFNIRQASASLKSIVPFWPEGTVFVSVVDPGVGTERVSCVARLVNGCYIVTPDNGTLSFFRDKIAEVRRIDESINRLPGSENCYIFHGRDVYAYTAGRLASGVISYEQVGPSYPVADVVILPSMTNVKTELSEGYAHAGFYDSEPSFGCLRVNIRTKDFQEICGFSYGDRVELTISNGREDIFSGIAYYNKTFGLVPKKVPFICGDIQLGDEQTLRFSMNEDNFFDLYAPELKAGLNCALDYSFTVRKIEG